LPAVEVQDHGIPQLEDTTMLSLALARALLPVSLGAASVGLLAGATDFFNHDPTLRAPSSSGSYEARLAGAVTGTLRGAVDHGGPATEAHPQSYVITLGAYSRDGALVFSRWNGAQPSAGSYTITGEPTEDGLTALVVTGSPTRPDGAFRADRGTVTITHSSPTGLAGDFELYARGFGVADPDRDDREVTVRGSFTTGADGVMSPTADPGPDH
jgi:hypothetical protein